MVKLSLKVQSIKENASLELNQKVSEAIQHGEKIYDLTASEFPFKPLPAFVDQIRGELNFLKSFQYASPLGLPELRTKLRNYFLSSRDLDLGNDQSAYDCLISNGSQQSLHNVFGGLIEEGDEVIIFKPYWVSFPEFVTLSDATPVLIDTSSENNFEPEISQIEEVKNVNTKGIIINSPSNPTGAVWSQDKIIEILKIAEKNDWIVISDECYERLVFDGQNVISQKLADNNDIKANILTCMSMSKTYAMTGWRIGYAFGKVEIIKAMSKIQGQATSCANSIGQAASIEALIGSQQEVENMINIFKKRLASAKEYL